MSVFETKITYKAVKNLINKIESPIKEVVANALDANAKNIHIKVYKQEIKENIMSFEANVIEVLDDGDGIDINDFENIFCSYRDSNKSEDKTKYGKKGKGRYIYLKLTNFSCQNIEIYTKDRKDLYKISYQCEKHHEPIKFIINKVNSKDSEDFSTKVVFKNIYIEDINDIEEIKNFIKDEIVVYFADVLSNKNIFVNGTKLNIDDFLIDKKEEEIKIDNLSFFVKYYFWNDRVKLMGDRQKHIQFFDLNDHLKGIKPSGKDKLSFYSKRFPHTVVVKSNFFNDYEDLEELFDDAILKELTNKIKINLENMIIKIYKSKIDEVTDEYISFLKSDVKNQLEKNVYSTLLFPFANKLINNRLKDDIKRLITNLIKVLINEDPAVFIQNLNTILGESPENNEIIRYVEENYGVLKTIIERDKLISRLDFLNHFENMVYGEKRKNIKERTQLHLVVEKNLWIFGEEFEKYNIGNIFSDVSIKTIIEKEDDVKVYLSPELKNIKNINKIPDIVIPLKDKNTIIIIELKKPGVKINDNIIIQIKNKYIKTLKEIDKIFNQNFNLKAIAISDDKTELVSSVGSIDENGYIIKPATWQEVITNTKQRYEKNIGIYAKELKNSKWQSLKEFIEAFK